MNPEITLDECKEFIEELLYKLFLDKFKNEREFIHHGVTLELAEEFYDDLRYQYKLSTMDKLMDFPVDLANIIDKAYKKYYVD